VLRLTQHMQAADEVLKNLARVDIDIDQVTQCLVEQGIEKLNPPYDSLMETLAKARVADKPAQQSLGVILGAVLGKLARRSRDKVTFITPHPLDTLGM
jgi:hypothetical protein